MGGRLAAGGEPYRNPAASLIRDLHPFCLAAAAPAGPSAAD
jgi:hypothetical protein